MGIGFSMVYGAMLTKTNRISRIFQSASQSARRPSYISPRSQLIITAVLVSVQFMAAMVWIVASIPDAEKDFPTRSEVSNYYPHPTTPLCVQISFKWTFLGKQIACTVYCPFDVLWPWCQESLGFLRNTQNLKKSSSWF